MPPADSARKNPLEVSRKSARVAPYTTDSLYFFVLCDMKKAMRGLAARTPFLTCDVYTNTDFVSDTGYFYGATVETHVESALGVSRSFYFRDHYITQTRLCNIQRLFTAVKIIILG